MASIIRTIEISGIIESVMPAQSPAGAMIAFVAPTRVHGPAAADVSARRLTLPPSLAVLVHQKADILRLKLMGAGVSVRLKGVAHAPHGAPVRQMTAARLFPASNAPRLPSVVATCSA